MTLLKKKLTCLYQCAPPSKHYKKGSHPLPGLLNDQWKVGTANLTGSVCRRILQRQLVRTSNLVDPGAFLQQQHWGLADRQGASVGDARFHTLGETAKGAASYIKKKWSQPSVAMSCDSLSVSLLLSALETRIELHHCTTEICAAGHCRGSWFAPQVLLWAV